MVRAIGWAMGRRPWVVHLSRASLERAARADGFVRRWPAATIGLLTLATLFGWYEAGGLRPHVSHVLPFQAFPEGLQLLRDRKATGKVVIRVGQTP